MRTAVIVMVGVVGGCGGNDGPADDEVDAAPPAVTLAVPCGDSVDDLYMVPSSLPPYEAARRGDVFRCRSEGHLDAATVDALARANFYVGPELTSGATIFRIAYRTERVPLAAGGDPPGAHSAAFLLVPDRPREPGALAVYAHPSIGIAPSCAMTRLVVNASGDGAEPVRAPLLAMVGAGWTVVAPDSAGYGYGDGPPGWALSADEAKSLLDATRAAAAALPTELDPDKVVIVGHSVGGHGAISAHAAADGYGLAGELVGVVALTPLWTSNLAWAALVSDVAGFYTARDGYMLEYQLDYFYAHGELLDGPGQGTALIIPEKRAAVAQMLTTMCLDDVAAAMPTLGARPSEYFDPVWTEIFEYCGITGDCTDPRVQVWLSRFLADRPAIDTAGPPLALWFSEGDTTVSPGFARCALDKIEADLAAGGTTTLTVCSDPSSAHIEVPERDIAWVNDWIAARVGVGAEPPCTAPRAPADGGPSCPTPPPNL